MRAVVIEEGRQVEVVTLQDPVQELDHPRRWEIVIGASGILDADVFISDRLPLADYAEALARFERGEGRKIQVIPFRDTGSREALMDENRKRA